MCQSSGFSNSCIGIAKCYQWCHRSRTSMALLILLCWVSSVDGPHRGHVFFFFCWSSTCRLSARYAFRNVSPVGEMFDVLRRRGTIATTFFLQHPGRDSQGARLCLVMTSFLAVTETTAIHSFFLNYCTRTGGQCSLSQRHRLLFLQLRSLPQERPPARKRCVGEVLRCCSG